VNVVEKVMRILENNLRSFVEEEVYGLLKARFLFLREHGPF